MANHSRNAVFSNIVVARPVYRRKWLKLANDYFDYVEGREVPDRKAAPYGSADVQLKVFVQERFVSAILASDPALRVIAPQPPADLNAPLMRTAMMCDFLKEHHCVLLCSETRLISTRSTG
jgi:hypothetical protein